MIFKRITGIPKKILITILIFFTALSATAGMFTKVDTKITGRIYGLPGLEFQYRMVMAWDNNLYVLLQKGTTDDSKQSGLCLYRSTDNGNTWNFITHITKDPIASGSMILERNGNIRIVYSKRTAGYGSAHDIGTLKFRWNGTTYAPPTGRYFVVNSNAVEGASVPSVAQDSQGILWVAYKHCDGVTYSIRV